MISLKRKTLTSLLFTLVLAFFTVSPAFAEENVISSVTISKAKDKVNSYELNIDSTQQVHYKSNIDEDGNIYFDLKNSVLANDLGTIYDDVSNIDNVVVKQVDKNRVRIYVKGQNAKNTELIFVNSLFETEEKAPKAITINRPINAYQPTSHDTDLENQDDDIQDWDDNSFNFSHLLMVVLSNLKDGALGVILIVLSLFTILAVIAKNLTRKITQDKEPLIGLNTSRILNNEEGNVAPSNSRMVALQNAQQELSKAHQKYQTYIQNKYKDTVSPKQTNISAVTKGIALNQYQRSTKNPYLDQEVIKIKKELSNNMKKEENFKIPPRPRRSQPNDFTSPYIRRTENKINYTPKTTEKQNSMKFLESVTKIYEQSGRTDLATGLKNSITKAKQTI